MGILKKLGIGLGVTTGTILAGALIYDLVAGEDTEGDFSGTLKDRANEIVPDTDSSTNSSGADDGLLGRFKNMAGDTLDAMDGFFNDGDDFVCGDKSVKAGFLCTSANKLKVRGFADVAGMEEEKEELREIIDFLRDPQKYNEMGIKMPKGILLEGDPGTGKTLLGKALAAESKVNFIYASGSEFVEKYVGVGAARIRELFALAKKKAPCVIFIDEIDAVGAERGDESERNQTLNQLLVKLDGFENSNGVILLAATNRSDMLDKALVRSGRFDRKISVGLPDRETREKILRLHCKNKNIDKNIDFNELSRETSGVSGADLANIINEAALFALRSGRKMINKKDILEAMDRILIGIKKKNKNTLYKDRELTAYHEAGHAIVSHFIKSGQAISKISILKRGNTGGATSFFTNEKNDRIYTVKSELLKMIETLLGGRAAEKIMLGDISSGAYDDISRATELAKNIVLDYGMSNSVGPVNCKVMGPEAEKECIGEVKEVIKTAYSDALKIIKAHITELKEVAAALLKNETISGQEFLRIVDR